MPVKYGDVLANIEEAASNDSNPMQFMDITPEVAATILACHGNKKNRDLRPGTVDGYACDMRGGLWTLNTDAINFFADGTMGNGHHRLTAVVKSGTTQRFLLVFNVPRSVGDGQDIGKRRQPHEQFKMDGDKYASVISATIGYIAMHKDSLDRGKFTGQTPVWLTPAKRKAMRREDPAIYQAVLDTAHIRGLDRIPHSISAAFVYLIRQTGDAEMEKDLFKFLVSIEKGTNLSEESIAYKATMAIRKAIKERKETGTTPALAKLHNRFFFLIKCWSIHAKGETRVRVHAPAKREYDRYRGIYGVNYPRKKNV